MTLIQLWPFIKTSFTDTAMWSVYVDRFAIDAINDTIEISKTFLLLERFNFGTNRLQKGDCFCIGWYSHTLWFSLLLVVVCIVSNHFYSFNFFISQKSFLEAIHYLFSLYVLSRLMPFSYWGIKNKFGW